MCNSYQALHGQLEHLRLSPGFVVFPLSVCGIRFWEVTGGHGKIVWPGQKVISLGNKAVTAFSESTPRDGHVS